MEQQIWIQASQWNRIQIFYIGSEKMDGSTWLVSPSWGGLDLKYIF